MKSHLLSIIVIISSTLICYGEVHPIGNAATIIIPEDWGVIQDSWIDYANEQTKLNQGMAIDGGFCLLANKDNPFMPPSLSYVVSTVPSFGEDSDIIDVLNNMAKKVVEPFAGSDGEIREYKNSRQGKVDVQILKTNTPYIDYENRMVFFRMVSSRVDLGTVTTVLIMKPYKEGFISIYFMMMENQTDVYESIMSDIIYSVKLVDGMEYIEAHKPYKNAWSFGTIIFIVGLFGWYRYHRRTNKKLNVR